MSRNQTARLRTKSKPDGILGRSKPQMLPDGFDHNSPEWAAQVGLSTMLGQPARPLLQIIQERVPGKDIDFYFQALQAGRDLIDQLIGGLSKRPGTVSAPILLDRLSFCWRLLRQADVVVRKTKKSAIPNHCEFSDAQEIFRDLLGSSTHLANPLLVSVLDALRLEPSGKYLPQYSFFRHSKKPTLLPSPFQSVVERVDMDQVRRVIWWCIRSRREAYIETSPSEPVRVEFSFLIEVLLQDLQGWCGRDVANLPGIASEVETEVNRWLKYSMLEPASENETGHAADLDSQREIARAFLKHNDLETKLHIHRAGSNAPDDGRIAELESRIRSYAEENRILEERLRAAHAEPTSTAQKHSEAATDASPFAELREALSTIDSKYSFDILNSVQLGEESHLTLKSFVAHLFYSLRKRGFGEYPVNENFTLSYEASGLYDCEGFEIPPGQEMPVRVCDLRPSGGRTPT